MDQHTNPEKSPKSATDQVAEFMKHLKLPHFDVDEMMASQRKNIEAFTKATEAALKGADAVGRHQAEIMKNAFEHAAEMMREHKITGSPQEIMAKQTELVRKVFEAAVARARELSEMVEKSNREAYEIVKHRMDESFKEIGKALSKKK